VVNLWWVAGEDVVFGWWVFGIEKYATVLQFIFGGCSLVECCDPSGSATAELIRAEETNSWTLVAGRPTTRSTPSAIRP
jgi:hypothetical protein